jgi:hypothetical protein
VTPVSAPLDSVTVTGTELPVMDPLPSWPKPFAPQQRTLPSAITAQV